MILKTKGKPAKFPILICKKALDWYARKLLTEKTYDEIEILLNFDDEELLKDEYGAAEWVDNNFRAREYILTIRTNLGLKNTLLTIAHEMVHVKQYATGELVDYIHTARQNKCRWRGKVRKNYENPLAYWDMPWEIEAHGREKGLYYQFVSEHKNLIEKIKKMK